MSSSYLIGVQVLDKLDPDRDTERIEYYWLYNILIILVLTYFNIINMLFLWIAYWDANRRNFLMVKLSNSLELDFHTKNSITVRLPTINFFDTESLLSWLEARKLVLEIGNRFQIRI